MLSEAEVNHLYGDGQALWLRIEEFGLAYHDRYREKSNLSKWLSYATVIAGISTAASTIPEVRAYLPTVFPAVITAVAAAISQILNPEKVQRETWNTWKQIEALKSELASRCRGLYLAVSHADEQIVIKGFSKHLDSLLEADIPVSELHRKAAKANLESANIKPRSTHKPLAELDHDENEADQEAVVSDGVQPMNRPVLNNESI
jgi:hypothetical protein